MKKREIEIRRKTLKEYLISEIEEKIKGLKTVNGGKCVIHDKENCGHKHCQDKEMKVAVVTIVYQTGKIIKQLMERASCKTI